MVLKYFSIRLIPILLIPPTKSGFKIIVENFWKKWNFSNRIEVIDGKHVRIFAPGKNNSLLFNYKDFFSIVLLAIVDANCKFILVSIGSYGKKEDSGIFNKYNISEFTKTGECFSSSKILPNSN